MRSLPITVDHESSTHAVRVCTGGPVIDSARARAAVETTQDLVAGHGGRLKTLIIDVEDLQTALGRSYLWIHALGGDPPGNITHGADSQRL